MKNAFVTEHHYGDNGAVTEGMVIVNMTEARFSELEKKGLVREASEAEVKAGHQHSIETDASAGDEAASKQKGAPANKKAAEPANKGA